jgi:hypothetical protein
MDDERRARIRGLNDDLRCRGMGGRVVVSVGLHALGPATVSKVLRLVGEFNAFTDDNDPYGEHDCATLQVGALSVLWKIDYYDNDLPHHSPDAADPKVTKRVLTVMLSEEY